MADQDDVRRIALALPEVTADDEGFGFGVAAPPSRPWSEMIRPPVGGVARVA